MSMQQAMQMSELQRQLRVVTAERDELRTMRMAALDSCSDAWRLYWALYFKVHPHHPGKGCGETCGDWPREDGR